MIRGNGEEVARVSCKHHLINSIKRSNTHWSVRPNKASNWEKYLWSTTKFFDVFFLFVRNTIVVYFYLQNKPIERFPLRNSCIVYEHKTNDCPQLWTSNIIKCWFFWSLLRSLPVRWKTPWIMKERSCINHAYSAWFLTETHAMIIVAISCSTPNWKPTLFSSKRIRKSADVTGFIWRDTSIDLDVLYATFYSYFKSFLLF